MIYLLRHGETVWNKADRRQGGRDSPLTSKGIAQAGAVAVLLSDLIADGPIPPIVSSPLGRAWQTAVIVAETLGADPDQIAHDERLAEVAYGQWEGLTVTEIRHTDPEHWAHRQSDRWTIAPPGGESYVDLQIRVGNWLAEQDRAEDLIVVGHGALNRALVSLAADLPPDEALDLPEDQQSVYRLGVGFYDIMGPASLDP